MKDVKIELNHRPDGEDHLLCYATIKIDNESEADFYFVDTDLLNGYIGVLSQIEARYKDSKYNFVLSSIDHSQHSDHDLKILAFNLIFLKSFQSN
ncbi:MAG: hypothetical protein V4683_13890 [Bacteroidota bacterium]